MKRDPRADAHPGRLSSNESPRVQHAAVPGKRTLTESLPARTQDSAQRGIATASSRLPYNDVIQSAFGRHDISGVQAHVGAEAAESAREMGARAYATGDHVVLGEAADLHTVAHEAAHVVQQRGGVQLKGGVGEAGDTYEQHADAVADQVVRGESAEALLDQHAGPATSSPGGGAVQLMRIAHPELPHDVETDNFEQFHALVNLFLKQSPDRIYALHMALLDGVGHDPKERRKHEKHFALVNEAMGRLERSRAPRAAAAVEQRPVPVPVPTDGLVMQRMGGYLAKVRQLEQQMLPMSAANDVVKALYEAAKLLLPELAKVFPELEIDEDGGDDASFSRGRWQMTIPTTDALEDQEATDLRHLSATVLHETRHLEQAWFEAVKAVQPRPGHRQPKRSTIAKDIDIKPEIFEQLITIKYPGIETQELGTAVAQGRRGQALHDRRMNRLESLRERTQFGDLGAALGVKKLAPLDEREEAEMALLQKQYYEFPREADAHNIEALYEDMYDGKPGPASGAERKGRTPQVAAGPWREQRVVAASDGVFVIDPDETPSNGDCFFESVIRLGLHGGRDVAALRQLARDNGARAEIVQAREWANLDDIAALATALGVTFVVVALDFEYKRMQESVRGNAGARIHVAQVFGGHFVPMRQHKK